MQTRLSFCYFLGLKIDKYFECAQEIVALRERFGSTEPLDDETERINLRIAAALKERETGEFDVDVFETSEFQRFGQKARELGEQTITKDEILADFEKIVPEELPDVISFLFQGMKDEMQKSMSEKQDDLTFPDIIEGVIESAVKISDQFREEIKRLKP